MKKLMKRSLFILGLAVACFLLNGQDAAAKAKKTYTISAKTKPCYSKYKASSVYNSKSKHYYLLRSYLEKLETEGGGTLVLKKGTYNVCSTLYVPSNVTIKLKNGTTIKKTSSTGTKKLESTPYLFQLIRSSKANKKNVTATKASKNVVLQGSGKAVINMGKISDAIGISMAHNSNITVQGIQFKAKKGGSYIAISGCSKVTIDKCKFYEGTKVAGSEGFYAIRLETATKATDSFDFSWSKMDNTTNKSITISNSYFTDLRGCIGSTKYAAPASKVLYQEGITITNNKFHNIDDQTIKGLAWKGVKITSNQFYRGDKTKKSAAGIYLAGAINPVIELNRFNYISTPIEFQVAKNTGKGKGYVNVANTVSTANINSIGNNTVTNADQYYVPYNNGTVTRLTYFVNKSDSNLIITKEGVPYRDHYTDLAQYGSNTLDYFKFRACMEQLEASGGGTLTVKAGDYTVSNAIYVPSNVTVIFEEGAHVNKVAAKYTANLTEAKSMFVLCPPSLAGTQATISDYNGSHDVIFQGTGTTQINCNYLNNAIALVIGHSKNVTITGIKFSRFYGYHLIELNSSDTVMIDGCSFSDFTPSTTDLSAAGEMKEYKEAINVDTADGAIGGFNYSWSTGSKTTCRNITIRNNRFLTLGTAIGSHTYTTDGNTQLYHENISITNNTIDTTLNSGITALNWKNAIITQNTFKNIGYDKTSQSYGSASSLYGIYARGVNDITIKGNIFDTCYIAVYIKKSQTSLPAAMKYDDTYSILTEQNWYDLKENTLIDCLRDYMKLSSGFVETDFPAGYSVQSLVNIKLDSANCSHPNRDALK